MKKESKGGATDKGAKGGAASKRRGVLWQYVSAVLVVLGAVVAAYFVASAAIGADRERGKIEGATACRLGDSVVLTLTDAELADGKEVAWHVDGKKCGASVCNGDRAEFEFQPDERGLHHVKATFAGGHAAINVEVKNPLLSVKVNDVCATYGDEVVLCGVSCDCAALDLTTIEVQAEGNAKNVGVYKLTAANLPSLEGYDVVMQEGTLEILPREVSVSDVFYKEYDGTNVCQGRRIGIEGVLEGDVVACFVDKIYFADKNVGADKKISTYNFTLEGDDASNYRLSDDEVYGEIAPRALVLEGVAVSDKAYDGTATAVVCDCGRLRGVLDGDVVQIGELSACFFDAKAGKDKAVDVSATLVGKDKDNYAFSVSPVKASIVANYLDTLLNRPDVVQSAD